MLARARHRRGSPSRCSTRSTQDPERGSLDLATGPGYVAATSCRSRSGGRRGSIAPKPCSSSRASTCPVPSSSSGDVDGVPFEDESFDAVTGSVPAAPSRRARAGAGQRRRACSSRRCRGVHGVGRAESSARWLGVLVDADRRMSASRATADVPAGPPFFRFADEDELTAPASPARAWPTPAVDTVDVSRSHVGSADELWDGLIEGAVRMRARRACSERRRSAFDQSSVRRVARRPHRRGTGFEVSVAVKLGSGRKP